MGESVRLQAYLSRCGICSRRAGEQLIVKGLVKVNGRTVRKLGTSVSTKDEVTVSGKRVVSVRQERVMYLYHKPRRVISSMSDPEGRRCIGDLISELGIRLFSVGRLDFDVSGLVLLTNDGQYAQELSHPRYQVERRYLASTKSAVTKLKLEQLHSGVWLSDGFAKVTSVRIVRDRRGLKELLGDSVVERSVLEIVVTEGRNHFVKNLLSAVGLPLCRLCRVGFGPYRLGRLRPGELKKCAISASFAEKTNIKRPRVDRRPRST